MKSIVKLLFAILLCQLAAAQNQVAKINISPPIDTTEAFRNALFNKGKLILGVQAGYTHGNLRGGEITYTFADSQTKPLNSFHGGLTLHARVGKNFWLKHELMINQRGAGVNLTDSINDNYASKMQMLYLDVYPISPTLYFKGFQLYAAPYVSALVNANIMRKDLNGNFFRDNTIFGAPGNNESSEKYLQKIDFGICFGAEYKFPFGAFIGARYTHGLADIFQYANSYTFQDVKTDSIKIYNQALMISVGYYFERK